MSQWIGKLGVAVAAILALGMIAGYALGSFATGSSMLYARDGYRMPDTGAEQRTVELNHELEQLDAAQMAAAPRAQYPY